MTEAERLASWLLHRQNIMLQDRDAAALLRKLEAQNETLTRGIECYKEQLRRDTVESDIEKIMAMGLEIAKLKVENEALRQQLDAALVEARVRDWNTYTSPPNNRAVLEIALAALEGLVKRVGLHAYEPQYTAAVDAIALLGRLGKTKP